MFFNKDKRNWKDCLSVDDKEVLCELLVGAEKHKCAICCSDDSQLTQLWCALIEFKKEFNQLKQISEITQSPFKAIVEMGDIEKRKTIDRFIRTLIRPDPEQEATIQNLVNSLMKF